MKYRTEYTIFAVLGAITIAVIALMVVAGFVMDERRKSYYPSTFSININGALVYYTLLERSGFEVSRMLTPFEAEQLEQTDVMVSLGSQTWAPYTELQALRAWIEDEGGVFIAPYRMAWALSVTNHFAPPAKNKRVSRDDGGTNLVMLINGLRGLSSNITHMVFEDPLIFAYSNMPPAGCTNQFILLEDTVGPRWVGYRLGRGAVILLSDPSFLRNRMIFRADNAVASVHLAAYARALAGGRRLAFNEYYLGFGRHETSWMVMRGMLFKTSAGWGILVLGLAGLLYMFNRGRQFGARRDDRVERRRAKMEYVEAAGAVYRRANACRPTLESNYGAFLTAVKNQLNLPPSAGAADVARALARTLGKPADVYRSALYRCEQGIQGGCSQKELKQHMEAMAAIEREMHNAT